jgi:hypothetical protein
MVRFASSGCVAALVAVLVCSSPAAAQDAVAATMDSISTAMVTQASAPPLSLPLPANTPPSAGPSQSRPAALIPLYASFVTLQVLDLHSTAYALDRGAVEANPAIRGFVDNRVAMTALKAAGTAGVIYVSEKLRTKNKAVSLGLMIATNAAMTWVVQHNYRVAR